MLVWFHFIFFVTGRRWIRAGDSGSTATHLYRWASDVIIVVINVSAAAAAITLYSLISTAIAVRAIRLTHADHSSDTVRALPAVRCHQKSSSPTAAAGTVPVRLHGRRTTGDDRGRRQHAAAGPTRPRYVDGGSGVDSSDLPTATRHRGTGRGCCRCCGGSNLDETLAEDSRIVDDNVDPSVCCCTCSLVTSAILPPSQDTKVYQQCRNGEGRFIPSLSFLSVLLTSLSPSFPASKWPLKSSWGIWGTLLAHSPCEGERHLQPPDTFHGLWIRQKIVCGRGNVSVGSCKYHISSYFC